MLEAITAGMRSVSIERTIAEVRIFPRQLATFRQVVDARGESLRRQPFEELASMMTARAEDLVVDGRRATVNTIVETVEPDRLRIVVQGFMPSRLVPGMHHVALDGFYKSRDGAVAPMLDQELWAYD